jgi:DNA topoisomerase-1
MIVDALLSRKYVEREQGGQMRLTQRGRDVCAFLLERYPDLFDLAFTAQMESDLDDLANGKESYNAAVADLWGMLKE